MRPVKVLMWLVVATVGERSIGYLLMAVDGYDYSGPFFPQSGSLAEVGLALALLGDLGVALLLVVTWLVLSTRVVSVRNRLPDIGWRHGAAGVWWWWWVPVAWLWMPRSVYAEIMERTHPGEDKAGLVNIWWGWWLAFSLTPLLLFIPGGRWWLFGAAAIPVIPGAMATVKASTVLDAMANPTAVVTEPITERGVTPTVPGWYYDPTGKASHQAWWDGTAWTGATRPDPGSFPEARH
jgi:hypothetical protein